MRSVIETIARTFDAYKRCQKAKNHEWRANHWNTIIELCRDELPSGSGVDCGTKFDFDASCENKMVFSAQYHHMDENGMYDGWTSHQIIVRPSLVYGLDIRITGRDRNQIKEYLHEIFRDAFQRELVYDV